LPRLARFAASGLIATTALLAVPATSQETGPSALIADAARMAQSGDFDPAIAQLEGLREAGTLGEAGQSLLGEIYLQADRAPEALATLEPLTQLEGVSASLLLTAGRAATRAGDPEKAATLLSRALQTDPTSEAAKELGMLFGAMGDYSRSYPLILAWVRQHPDDGTALLLAALAAVELERPNEAIQLLDVLASDDPRVRLLRARALVLSGNGNQAISLLEPLLAQAPPDQAGELRNVLADAYLQAELPDKAIELIEGNVGDDVGLAIKLSAAFEKAGYLPSAASAIKRFVEPLVSRLEELPEGLAVDAADMALRYGRLMLETGNSAEAAGYLEVATKLEPAALEGWQLLARARESTGQSAAAAEASARAEKLAELQLPDSEGEIAVRDDTAHKIREAMLLSRTDPRAALEALQAEAQIVPSDPRPPLAAARILLNLSQLPEARAAADFALQLVPARSDAAAATDEVWKSLRVRALSLKARIAASQNELPEARELLGEVLKLDPENAQVRERLMRLNAQP
jgi:predicted Zn-dependent protease